MKISLYGVKGFECVDRLTGLRRVHRDPTKRILQLSYTLAETRLEICKQRRPTEIERERERESDARKKNESSSLTFSLPRPMRM